MEGLSTWDMHRVNSDMLEIWDAIKTLETQTMKSMLVKFNLLLKIHNPLGDGDRKLMDELEGDLGSDSPEVAEDAAVTVERRTSMSSDNQQAFRMSPWRRS